MDSGQTEALEPTVKLWHSHYRLGSMLIIVWRQAGRSG